MFISSKEVQISQFIKNKLYEICITGELRASRFFVYVCSFVIGLLFIIEEMYTYLSPIHYFIVNIIPGEVWGLLFLFASIVGFVSLILSIKNAYTLILDGVLSCVLWTAYSTATVLAYHHVYSQVVFTIDCVSNILITLLVWWCMIRCWASRKNVIPINVIDKTCLNELPCAYKPPCITNKEGE